MLKHTRIVVGFTLALSLLLGGCTAQLAPSYDAALVESINETNPSLLVFFASVDEGAQSAGYGGREKTYNGLIGRFEAMAAQSRARPIPDSEAVKRIDKAFARQGWAAPVDGQIPSAVAFDMIAGTLTKMRNTDKKQGLTKMEVAAFKGQCMIALDQALTYEAFLER